MKKSLTENRKMTLGDILDLCVYRPYEDDIKFMITEDERIVFEGEGWSVIMDSDNGEFHFSGELHKYYDVDTIVSLRDHMGDIYSGYRLWGKELEKGVYYQLVKEKIDKRSLQKEYRRKYYEENRERIKEITKKRYWENRDSKKEQYINKIEKI